MKEYFRSIFHNNIVTNKKFWNSVRPVLASKGSLFSCKIIIKKESKIINDIKKIVEFLNDHYVNIVDRS